MKSKTKKTLFFTFVSTIILSSSVFIIRQANVATESTLNSKVDIATESLLNSEVGIVVEPAFNLEVADTLSRGYQLIDGDVYDKYGTLLIKMEDGLTPDGFY